MREFMAILTLALFLIGIGTLILWGFQLMPIRVPLAFLLSYFFLSFNLAGIKRKESSGE